MPAPDVQYFLDCSATCGQIAGDTHFYFMEMCPNTNEVFDAYDRRDHAGSYWKSLTAMGLYFEDQYIQWRANNRHDSKMASYASLELIPTVFKEMVDTASGYLADSNLDHVDSNAINFLNDRMELEAIKGVVRRSLMRTACDFNDLAAESITAVSNQIVSHQEQNRMLHQIALNESNFIMDDGEWIDSSHGKKLNKNEIQRIVREKKEENKKIIKRSVKFLNKLIGSDTTRIFLGGNAIRFEGEYAIYELSKQSNVMESHGGFKAVSIYDKNNPDLLLCNLCISTPNVPLLDHVANIVMHIRAGEELEILRIGNARNIDSVAYDKEWLNPYLPSPTISKKSLLDNTPIIPGLIAGMRPDRAIRSAMFKPIITQMMYNEVIEEFSPMILKANPQTLGLLTTNSRTQPQELCF